MSAGHLVELYGLTVASPVALQGWPLAASADAEVVVRFEAQPPGADTWDLAGEAVRIFQSEAGPDEEPNLVAHRFERAGYLRLVYAEGMRFHVALDGSEVWAAWRAPMTEADAVTFLLGPVMGIVLRHKRVVTIHASAVMLDDAACAFVGPGGAGKSTLAAAFAARGAAMLTEDVLALRPTPSRGWLVAPGYAEIRLWDEGAALVVSSAETLPALSPTWSKRGLDLRQHALPFVRDPALLGALCILEEARAGSPEPQCVRLGAADGLLDLVANAYVNYLATATALAADLRALSEIARTTPIWRLRPGMGRDGLARTVDLVRATVRPGRGAKADGDITK